jgi:WD40 repeat protein
VVGTLGYMAPELSQGLYSPRSDIYALGCVLLELLGGARVGATTVGELEDAAIEEGAGVAAVLARAEACWPPPAAAALAALALACIHHSPKRRPGEVSEVLAALRALRVLLAPADAPPLQACPVCLEDVPEAGGLRCSAGSHFICHGCLQEHVRSRVAVLAELRASQGNIPCHVGGCASAWRGEELQEVLDKGTWVALFVALRRMAIDGPAEAAALAERQRLAVEGAGALALGARVAALRRVIVERDLLLRCPACAAEFEDFSGCNALTCGRCGTGFCAVCLQDCGSYRETHRHHRLAHSADFYDRGLFERASRARYLARLVAAVRAAGDATVQRALVAELGRADLRDLGISEGEVLAGAGVAGAGAGAGAGAAAGAGVGAAAGGAAGGAAALPVQVQHLQSCAARLPHGGSGATGLAVVEGGLLASGGRRDTLTRLWRLGEKECAAAGSLEGAPGALVAALPGGRLATAGYTCGAVSVWEAGALRQRVCELPKGAHTEGVASLAALPGGLLATGSDEKSLGRNWTIGLWCAATGARVGTLDCERGHVYALAVLGDGRLASGSGSTLRLWDLATRTCSAALRNDKLILALAALEEGRLACGEWKTGAVQVWNTVRGAREATLQGHTDSVRSLAALPRGLLASGSDDASVRVWCIAARACLAVLQGHSAPVVALAALPGGRLASGSSGDAGVVGVWDVSQLKAGTPDTGPGATGPPCATCSHRTLGPIPAAGGAHLCFLCRHVIPHH